MNDEKGVVDNNQPKEELQPISTEDFVSMIQPKPVVSEEADTDTDNTDLEDIEPDVDNETDDVGSDNTDDVDTSKETNQDDNTDDLDSKDLEQPKEQGDVFDLGELGKFTKDELKQMKSERMMHSDYTKKTQELAKQRKELEKAVEVYEYLQNNKDFTKALAYGDYSKVSEHRDNLKSLDPNAKKLEEIDIKLQEIELEKTLLELENKHKDFNKIEVLQEASKTGMKDYESIYYMLKGRNTNIEEIEKRLEKDIEKRIVEKLKKNKNSTSTIVKANDKAPVKKDTPKLSKQEMKLAEAFGLTADAWEKSKNRTN